MSEPMWRIMTMFSHESVWAAIDALAERHSLSASGLARRAGLDPTTFNKSKRYASDGRARWPSTESLAKVMEATGSTFDEFTRLIQGENRTPQFGEYTQDMQSIRCLAWRKRAPEAISTMPVFRQGRAGTSWSSPPARGRCVCAGGFRRLDVAPLP